MLTLPPLDTNGNSEFRSTACRSGRPSRIFAKLGETQLWTVKNDTEWDHPFHLHGFFFLPLDEQAAADRARWRGKTRSTSR